MRQRFPVAPVESKKKVGHQQRLFVIVDFQAVKQDEHDKQYRGKVQTALPLAGRGKHRAKQENKLAGGKKARPAVMGFGAEYQRGGGKKGE